MEKEFLEHIEQHKALLYKVCHTFECTEALRRDLFQDIIVQLWRAFPNFKAESKWSTWAYRIALNVAITQRRKKKLSLVEFSDSLRQSLESAQQDRSAELHAEERLAALHQAISQLNEAEKALILLYLDDIPYAEIAEITGITENNVGVKLNRIKSKLKSFMLHGK